MTPLLTRSEFVTVVCSRPGKAGPPRQVLPNLDRTKLSAERDWIHEVHERPLAVDVDLLEAVAELGAQHVTSLLAEMAALRVVQDDLRDRSRA